MKTKKQKAVESIRKPRKMNHPFNRRRKGYIEVQDIIADTSNQLLCAGVQWVPEMTAKVAYRIASSWARWRRWYDSLPENRRLAYPAKQDHGKRVGVVSLFPVNVWPIVQRLDVFIKGGIAV